MASKIKNPAAKSNSARKTNATKATKPVNESLASKKEAPTPVGDSAKKPSPRVLSDEIIQEHLIIRRAVNITYLSEISRIFCENAPTFVNEFLSMFDEEQAKELASSVNMNRVEIATYEAIASIAVPGSPLANTNRSLYNVLRDISRKAEGCHDDLIAAEVIDLDQYLDQPKYLVVRESAYVFGIDPILPMIRQEHPRFIVWLANDRSELNPVIANFLILHIDAWFSDPKSHDYVTDEKIEEYLAKMSDMVNAIAAGAMTATHMNMSSNPNTDLHAIIQRTENPYYTLNQIYSFSGVSTLTMTDDRLEMEAEEPSIEDLLAGDGVEEDDRTLMDVIAEETKAPAKSVGVKKSDADKKPAKKVR